ncbi:UDP-N-acetylmuramoyl-tripeptide--D-alanyl-D-alanine ligase [Neptunomonas phycophila]|uniref:UDP-N-acetylmuramoyl-tripeptide--D-alanyl-D-alanine ligase n=2 Tax=Neptunomonas phycophila TaxID=1572645 RepID=A0ABT9ESR1_9GAMM|nr:UDP-N-acetylmuramoyl-tripeptide--D-alanyl-D-alanine ligase [Neptunomonas phycophila]MDP2522096.1 UDP-N-acetylmuramoyl-tripeptide--D-alanyl-D-alanine ligase [Neptunomonas phycophila]
MMKPEFSLNELLAPLDARLAPCERDINCITGVTTDTRAVKSGDLFIALKGERFDAHDFVEQAIDAGASALLVERELPVDVPQLIVSDTRIALGKLAEYNRSFFTGLLFAITGSSGKTTVKEMLATVLANCGNTLATLGNLNNDIGVPLTLLRLSPEHEYAVIEMGASGAGEIAYSVALAHPHIAIVNNAMAAHLEGFGSLQGVIDAKGEIYDGLSSVGTAVVNLDDAAAKQWLARIGNKPRISFSVKHEKADLYVRHVSRQLNGCFAFDIVHGAASATVTLQVLGAHNIANAAAVSALMLAAGFSLDVVADGLSRFKAVKGRLCTVAGLAGALVIDDTYNANQGSVMAAIDTLAELPGERMLILGDLGELGVDAESIHYALGQYAAEQKIDRFFAVGDLCKEAVQGYQTSGGELVAHFADKDSLLKAMEPLLHSDLKILVKGSRSAGMESVVAGLTVGDK